MMPRIWFLLFIAPAFALSTGADSMDLPRLGTVAVIDTAGPPSGVVIVFSDPAATHPAPRESFRALSTAGQVVAVVDSHRYLATLADAENGCARASDDFLALKSKLFAQYHLSENGTSVLAGAGSGGALAYAVLSQSKAGQFSGAVAFEFNPELPGRAPLCSGAPYEKTPAGFRYLPSNSLNGFWRIATASPEDAKLRPYAQLQKDVIFPLRPYDDFTSAVISIIADRVHPPEAGGGKIEDLPLVLLPADPHGKTMAVIYSGDGGWRDLDKKIGEELRKAHIPVVGVDTLRYFWHRQTPEMATKGLESIIEHFANAWNTPDVLLIGYSFGADIIPFMVNRAKPAVLDQIRLISLLSLSRTADFEIRMSGWIGGASSPDALPLPPELKKLDPLRVQCFLGVEDQDESGCTDASLAGAQIIKTSGGHHFDGDYGKMVRTIIDGAVRLGAGVTAGEGAMTGGNLEKK
ncbi:MAG: AcvB/VirJ family lysyl-phosphatidylglycerol hydrolase [Pseudomonadota bacterium]